MPKLELRYEVTDSGCWEVTSHSLNKDGYPLITRGGKLTTTHRYVFEDKVCTIPEGMLVRHVCDNKICCNPQHLLIGNHVDNVNDRVSRGRSANGENHGRSKLKKEDILFIRASSMSGAELSRVLGVSKKTVYNILNNKTWLKLD